MYTIEEIFHMCFFFFTYVDLEAYTGTSRHSGLLPHSVVDLGPVNLPNTVALPDQD